jgi:hypothetical protein
MRTLTILIAATVMIMMVSGMTLMRESHTAPQARHEAVSVLEMMSKARDLPVTAQADAF